MQGDERATMGFLKEFKDFINSGNVMDMAVGIIIGAALTAIVTSLTNDIINPFLKLITGGNGTQISGLVIPVGGGSYIDFGAFISAIINFLIIALVVFFLVKAVNKMQATAEKLARVEKEETVPAPTCPFCKEEIKEGATLRMDRCPRPLRPL